MDKELFRQLMREHKTISVGLNPFDPAEINATYSLFTNDDVYEIFDDNTFEFLFNLNNDADLDKFADDILQDVVSHSYDDFFKCVAYIKANLEHWEIEKGWSSIGNRMPLPNDIAGHIYDLIDDYTEDNELTDDWWSCCDIEDFFKMIEDD